jgi:hypothetical protein
VKGFRDFSVTEGLTPRVRSIDNDAPASFRNELVDLIFCLAEKSGVEQDLIYGLVSQNLGVSIAGKPYGGYRYAVGRDISKVQWNRVFDLIPRLANEFRRVGVFEEFREAINKILAANGIVWDLDENGHLVRVLPGVLVALVKAAVQELSSGGFEPALALLNAATDAYNDHPRRDRDACANAFDAMESVAKTVYQKPNATFGAVLHHIRGRQSLQDEIIKVLEGINTLRNSHFGHGMVQQFKLSSQEVDFTYLTCIAATLMFARI